MNPYLELILILIGVGVGAAWLRRHNIYVVDRIAVGILIIILAGLLKLLVYG